MADLDDIDKELKRGHILCLEAFRKRGYQDQVDICEDHNRLMVIVGNGWYKEARNMHWWNEGPKRMRTARRLVMQERAEEQARVARLVDGKTHDWGHG